MTNTRLVRNVITVTFSLGILGMYGFNCSQHGFVVQNADLSSVNSNSAINFKPQYGVSVLSAEQVLRSMTSVTGIQDVNDMSNQMDADIRGVFALRSGSLPVTKDIDVITGPMMVSIANIAGVMCVKMVAQEKSIADVDKGTRRIFQDFEFSRGPASITTAALDQTARRMARAFWSRELKAEELDLIRSAMLSDFLNAPGVDKAAVIETENLSKGLCTAMLSSFDAIVH